MRGTEMAFILWSTFYLLWAIVAVSTKLTWGETEFLFTFGDSYTTDGFNISAGVNSPVPGFVSFLTSQTFITLALMSLGLTPIPLDVVQRPELGSIPR